MNTTKLVINNHDSYLLRMCPKRMTFRSRPIMLPFQVSACTNLSSVSRDLALPHTLSSPFCLYTHCHTHTHTISVTSPATMFSSSANRLRSDGRYCMRLSILHTIPTMHCSHLHAPYSSLPRELHMFLSIIHY